jgi:hypothetical protein
VYLQLTQEAIPLDMVLLPWWIVESTQETQHIRCSTGTTAFIAPLAVVFVIPV